MRLMSRRSCNASLDWSGCDNGLFSTRIFNVPSKYDMYMVTSSSGSFTSTVPVSILSITCLNLPASVFTTNESVLHSILNDVFGHLDLPFRHTSLKT